MSESRIEELEKRVEELTSEVAERESDLQRFRSELIEANRKLEGLIANLRHDIKVAHQIQRALVPTEFPNIPGFEFSTKFVASAIKGGDYFDIFEHDDKFRFGLLLANCSAPGLSAVLMSILLKMNGQLEARKGRAPELIVKEIFAELKESLRSGDSCHIFYAVVDRRSYEMNYCRMGNVVALIQQSEKGQLLPLDAHSSALSDQTLLDDIRSSSVMLNAKQRLVLCTHGVIEAQNRSQEMFGQERLVKAILQSHRRDVHELRNDIIFEVESFTGGLEPEMDRTVIVSEVKGSVIKLAKP